MNPLNKSRGPRLMIGGLIIRSMPSTPMTNEEMAAQNKLVSSISGNCVSEAEEEVVLREHDRRAEEKQSKLFPNAQKLF